MRIDRKEPKIVENGFKNSFPTFSLSFPLDTNQEKWMGYLFTSSS